MYPGLPSEVDKLSIVDKQSIRLQSFSRNNQRVLGYCSKYFCVKMGGGGRVCAFCVLIYTLNKQSLNEVTQWFTQGGFN